MSERIGNRTFGAPFVALTLLVSVASASLACRGSGKPEPEKDNAVQADASAASTPPAPAASASTASATLEAETDTAPPPGDGGVDGGKRRLRRLVGAGIDAGAAEPLVAAPEPAKPAASGKRPAPAAMGNEDPYGKGAGAGAPGLVKTPLPGDDPWK